MGVIRVHLKAKTGIKLRNGMVGSRVQVSLAFPAGSRLELQYEANLVGLNCYTRLSGSKRQKELRGLDTLLQKDPNALLLFLHRLLELQKLFRQDAAQILKIKGDTFTLFPENYADFVDGLWQEL